MTEFEHDVLRRLDLLQSTLALAFEPQISAARDQIRADEINASILDESEEWIGTGALQKKVSASTGKVERAVRNRFATLISQGALAARGTGAAREFRRTGLV